MPRAFAAGLVTPDSRRAGEICTRARASRHAGFSGIWSVPARGLVKLARTIARAPRNDVRQRGCSAPCALGIQFSIGGVPIGKCQTVAWDPQRFLAPYAERFIEELLPYSPRNYPNRDLTRRPPLMPRPKESRRSRPFQTADPRQPLENWSGVNLYARDQHPLWGATAMPWPPVANEPLGVGSEKPLSAISVCGAAHR